MRRGSNSEFIKSVEPNASRVLYGTLFWILILAWAAVLIFYGFMRRCVRGVVSALSRAALGKK
jgi:hypothetical protein